MSKEYLKKYYSNEDYFFSKQDNRILIKYSQQWVEVVPEVITEMLRDLWNSFYAEDNCAAPPLSLDTPSNENAESTSTHLDLLLAPSIFEPETAFMQNVRSALLRSAFHQLDTTQQHIIYGLFFEDLTENDLSRLLGISQPAVHYHKTKSLRMMRVYLEEAEFER